MLVLWKPHLKNLFPTHISPKQQQISHAHRRMLVGCSTVCTVEFRICARTEMKHPKNRLLQHYIWNEINFRNWSLWLGVWLPASGLTTPKTSISVTGSRLHSKLTLQPPLCVHSRVGVGEMCVDLWKCWAEEEQSRRSFECSWRSKLGCPVFVFVLCFFFFSCMIFTTLCNSQLPFS